MAIDSNKRDRRHSDNMDFMTPQLQRDVDPSLSPAVTTPNPGPQGLLISSPTMALPHASLPPYSGGFIVTGGPGGTQLVQMAPPMPGIPIVMPSPGTISASAASQPPALALATHSQAVSEEKEDEQSHGSADGMEPPPAKRSAPEPAHIKVGGGSGGRPGGYSIHQTSTGSFIMTHGGLPSGATPQLIQMGGSHGQIPIVVPTAAVRDQQPHKCPVPPAMHVNGRTDTNSTKPESLPISALSSHGGAGVAVLSQRGTSATVPAPHSARSLLQMAHHPNISGLIVPQQTLGAAPNPPQNGEERRKAEQDKATVATNPAPAAAAVKMPFANISIQPGNFIAVFCSHFEVEW